MERNHFHFVDIFVKTNFRRMRSVFFPCFFFCVSAMSTFFNSVNPWNKLKNNNTTKKPCIHDIQNASVDVNDYVVNVSICSLWLPGRAEKIKNRRKQLFQWKVMIFSHISGGVVVLWISSIYEIQREEKKPRSFSQSQWLCWHYRQNGFPANAVCTQFFVRISSQRFVTAITVMLTLRTEYVFVLSFGIISEPVDVTLGHKRNNIIIIFQTKIIFAFESWKECVVLLSLASILRCDAVPSERGHTTIQTHKTKKLNMKEGFLSSLIFENK